MSKLQVALGPGVVLTYGPMIENLSLIARHCDVTTVCSGLGENLLTFSKEGTPHLILNGDSEYDKFVKSGTKFLFSEYLWSYVTVKPF